MGYIVAAIVVLGLIWFAYQSLSPRQARPDLPDGLRFANASFELTVNQDAETITVRAANAMHTTPAGATSPQRRPLDLTFPAAGFHATITRETRPVRPDDRRRAERTPDVYTVGAAKPGAANAPNSPFNRQEETGFSTIVFTSRRHPLANEASAQGREMDTVDVAQVPNAEAEVFRTRFADVANWVAAMEAALRERVAAHTRATQAALHRAELSLASLSQDCDFEVAESAMDYDADGNLLWAVKLGGEGQCWIYAEGKTYLGPLAGGKASVLPDGLEVMVRDARWETTYFSRRKMKLFNSATPAVLAVWCDRINALTTPKRPLSL